MHKINNKNEQVKFEYRIILERAHGKDKKTITQAIQYINKYEKWTNFADFNKITPPKINDYVKSLMSNDYAMSYADHNVKAMKCFYTWLTQQKGYRNMDPNIPAYFQISRNQRNASRAQSYQESYTFNEIRQAINLMPNKSLIDMRNKALVSLQALCGLRSTELGGVKIKSLKLAPAEGRNFIYMDPKTMQIKFAKSRYAFFMPIPYEEEYLENIQNWYQKLISMGWQGEDPLFPQIPYRFNEQNLLGESIQKIGIKSGSSIRKIFKTTFLNASLPYHKPHNFRHMIARWGITKSVECFNAVSKSLGHSDTRTTFDSYASMSPYTIGATLNAQKG